MMMRLLKTFAMLIHARHTDPFPVMEFTESFHVCHWVSEVEFQIDAELAGRWWKVCHEPEACIKQDDIAASRQ